MTFEEGLHQPPSSIPTVDVALKHGPATFAALANNAIMWQAHRGAIAFLGWSPTPGDPARVAYGRILLEPSGLATSAMVKETARIFRAQLQSHGLRAIPLLGGESGMALWIPFVDGPTYGAIRARLDALADEVAREHPTLVTTRRPISERGDRVHVAASSNAVGRFSALPYTLRALDALPVVTPIAWDELASLDIGAFTATTFADRLAARGDVFAGEVVAIGGQTSLAFLKDDARLSVSVAFPEIASDGEPRGRIIRAALAILEDGKPRDADALLAEAIARDLIPKTTSRKDVYTELSEYISRAIGHGRTPKIIQDVDRRFRRNLPADDWPSPQKPLPAREPALDAQRIIARLANASGGDDPAVYEQAVCDAFAALGFVTTHLGGEAAPDGYADAPLGVAGYRVMLECKRAATIVMEPDAAEAAKYVGAYHAQYATLVGPSFGQDVALGGELLTHSVTAFTNDDLGKLVGAGADPYEMRAIFVPGFAAERIEALLWERDHGARKRLAVVCEILASAGWRNQRTAATSGDPTDAPRIDEDAAMMLVDERLLGNEGSLRPCTRAEVRAAFAHLTDPLVGLAVWVDETHAAIVITRNS